MVVAVAALGVLTYLAMEVTYDATVEYTVNSQALNRLKAHYAAKAGLDLSLLRIKIYQTVVNATNGNAGPYQQYVDEIWKFQFAWPLPAPPEMNSVDKDALEKMVKESSIDSSFVTTINDEGSKLDLNDLVSPSKSLKELAEKRLLEIFKRKVEEDEKWRQKYGAFRFEELIHNIADWMSDKNSSANGGDKRGGYQELNRDREYYPPNRGFRTMQEMRLVTGMTDEFFDLIAPQVTIYGMRGVNPNFATKDILKGLDRGITDEIADAIIARRDNPVEGGPFKEKKGFWEFVTGKGARLEAQDTDKIPLYFDTLISFRIKSTGEYAGATREIEVIVTDLDRTAKRIKEFSDADKKAEAGGAPAADSAASGGGATPGGNNQTNNQAAKKTPLPKGPPRIVYWTER